jgi:hypothetical protein
LIRRFEIKQGLTVECRWKGGAQHFPGKISKIEGDRIFIDYSDGDNGYSGSYQGTRDAYKNNYRTGFRQGYEDGYRDGTRYDRR